MSVRANTKCRRQSPDGFAEAYLRIPAEKIRAYSAAQFYHWTRETFPANFRKMLMLEQYRAPELARLYQNYLLPRGRWSTWRRSSGS